MPELPEAETIVRGLRAHVEGRTIVEVDVIHPDVLRQPRTEFEAGAVGARIERVDRRGKNVVVFLDTGVLAVNLGMTGRLLPHRAGGRAKGADHPAVRFRLDDGGGVVFDDTRRFGTVEVLRPTAWSTRSARMGPEPLAPGYRARRLAEDLSRSRMTARAWLLDQTRIAGVGNIYANEALYLAGVHPARRACDITQEEASRLHRGLRRILRRAIRAGGTTIRDYRTAQGEPGGYAVRLHVYGRDGLPCRACHATVQRTVFGGRSAFFCPGCQAT